MTDQATPTDDDIRVHYVEYAEEVFRSWSPGQPVPTSDELVAPFNQWLAEHDAKIRAELVTRDEGGDTPTEEEARHDFAVLVDWRYEERRAEFNRMLDVRDQALRAHCAAMVRGGVEEAMEAAYKADPGRYTPPSYMPGARPGMSAALNVIANMIEGNAS